MVEIEMKRCSHCEREFAATPECFYRDKSKKDGLCGVCKDCKRTYNRQRKEEKKAYDKVYRREHREEKKVYMRAYRREHRGEKKAYDKAYYQEQYTKHQERVRRFTRELFGEPLVCMREDCNEIVVNPVFHHIIPETKTSEISKMVWKPLTQEPGRSYMLEAMCSSYRLSSL